MKVSLYVNPVQSYKNHLNSKIENLVTDRPSSPKLFEGFVRISECFHVESFCELLMNVCYIYINKLLS